MKKPFTNSSDKIKHLGPVTVWPGQTREVDEAFLPGARAEEPATPPAPDFHTELQGLLENSIPVISQTLPGLLLRELTEIETAEQAADARKGVMEAITAERLRRADVAEAIDEVLCHNPDQIAEILGAMSDGELVDIAVVERESDEPRQVVLDMITAEQATR